MREINLFGLEQAGLIILLPTGIQYHNLTGGSACDNASAEGIFAPLENELLVDGISYRKFFQTLSDLTKDTLSIPAEVADKIDRIFNASCAIDDIVMDREQLVASREAWLYVNVQPAEEISDFTGFGPFKAVLTWPNSD